LVELSSCEAKYIASTTASCQGVWLGRLLARSSARRMALRQSLWTINPQFNYAKVRSSIIEASTNETWFHFINECANGGKIDVKCIGTKDQLADILARTLGLRWSSLVL
jgi:hypothetical protein